MSSQMRGQVFAIPENQCLYKKSLILLVTQDLHRLHDEKGLSPPSPSRPTATIAAATRIGGRCHQWVMVLTEIKMCCSINISNTSKMWQNSFII